MKLVEFDTKFSNLRHLVGSYAIDKSYIFGFLVQSFHSKQKMITFVMHATVNMTEIVANKQKHFEIWQQKD